MLISINNKWQYTAHTAVSCLVGVCKLLGSEYPYMISSSPTHTIVNECVAYLKSHMIQSFPSAVPFL